MNRKVILTAGTLLVAFAGVFAGRSSKATAPSLGFKSTGGVCHSLFSSVTIPANFTTTSGTNQAAIRTKGGTLDLVYTSTCSKKVYFIN